MALERSEEAGAVAPLGAASLLHRNDDARWPDEAGNDLVSRYPDITIALLARDHATIGDVFGEQLSQLQESDARTLVTITVGGNDLFSAFQNKPRASLLDRIGRDIAEAYEFLVERVRALRPNALVVLTTVNDPSDRLGKIPGVLEDAGKLPLAVLDGLNARIRELARGTPDVVVADAYLAFLGHGASVPDGDRWYWRRSLVELNAEGAHQLRRIWRDAIDGAVEDALG